VISRTHYRRPAEVIVVDVVDARHDHGDYPVVCVEVEFRAVMRYYKSGGIMQILCTRYIIMLGAGSPDQHHSNN
jgi:hypothetical protein